MNLLKKPDLRLIVHRTLSLQKSKQSWLKLNEKRKLVSDMVMCSPLIANSCCIAEAERKRSRLAATAAGQAAMSSRAEEVGEGSAQ